MRHFREQKGANRNQHRSNALSKDKDKRDFYPCHRKMMEHTNGRIALPTGTILGALAPMTNPMQMAESSNKGKVKSIESKVNRIIVQTLMVRFKMIRMKSNNKLVTNSVALFGKLIKNCYQFCQDQEPRPNHNPNAN